MIGYIKDINTFDALYYGNVTKYEAPIGSGKETTGTVVIPVELEDYSGHWLWVDNHLWLIKKSKPDNGQTTLTVADWVNAFERTIIYTSTAQQVYGDYIEAMLESDFIEQVDPQFAMPYITVNNDDDTTFAFPIIEDGTFYGEYSFADLMKSAISAGVIIDPSLTSDGLQIDITTKEPVIHRIIFGDGKSQLVSQEYSRNIISKITVYRENEEMTGWAESGDFYYHLDGTVSETPPPENLYGIWTTKIVPYSFEYDLIEAAKEDMAENVNSHKIQFYSTVPMRLWDDVVLAMPNGFYTSKISNIKVSSDDDRYYYECGQLDVCLTDKLIDERKLYLLGGNPTVVTST